MTLDEAVRLFRSDPRYSNIVRDSYFDADVCVAARRFEEPGEFAEVPYFSTDLSPVRQY
jgi:hypothetical protein